MVMERKAFKATPELKEDEPGSVRLVFATLGVIDSDEDVTRAGAFGEQTVRMQGSGHNTHDFMIGKGTIHEEGDKAICEHKINLNMEAGREAYAALKFDMENGEPLQEWSYVFDIIKSGEGEFEDRPVRFLEILRVHSVDPVFLGAGVETETLAVKSKDKPGKLVVAAHRTARADMATVLVPPPLTDFTDEPWDALDDGAKRRIAQHFARATAMPPARFGDLRGAHHEPSKEGAVGAVVWQAISAPAMLKAASSDGEFRRHIGGHYRQFGKTPPWDTEESGLSFDDRYDEAEHALYDVRAFIARSGELVANLREQDEQLTDRKRAFLDSLCADLETAHAELAVLLKSEPGTGDPPRTGSTLRFRLSELETAQRALAATGAPA